MAKEPDVSLGKTIDTQETQGTLEGSRVFLGIGSHCTHTLFPSGGAETAQTRRAVRTSKVRTDFDVAS